MSNSLSIFHPDIAKWFREEVGQPTEIQNAAWEKIARDEHVLISAPTGSGKTFTAFLWAINEYITGTRTPGHTSLLYISPLKALNNDIQRNLIAPISALKLRFEKEASRFPEIRVLTRSGDTPQSERRRMLRHPPEILITTPESLNLLLSSMGGRSILTNVTTVILDEIHALAHTKRGVHLITAVDRLVLLSGEFQRIALSATVRPMETIATFIGGYQATGTPSHPSYQERQVSIVAPEKSRAGKKRYDIQVRSPGAPSSAAPGKSIWDPIVDEFKQIIAQNRSVLIFANLRHLCEKLAFSINAVTEGHVAYAHHGSLSREIREDVERAFKNGRLKTIVATNSLELGIDIGTLDQVLLVDSPPSISSAIQRLGRSGHRVGDISHGVLFPTHAKGLIEAAALVPAVVEQDIETKKPMRNPLDILAQVVISMTGVETWDIDALFFHIRTSYPYRHLNREHFDRVLNMLEGRYGGSRIRELRPRVSIDRIDNTVRAKRAALLSLYMSGGTIPDRGYYALRHFETGARIGELDEEFVWEARIGQTFTLGTQNWRINRLTHSDVFVHPGSPRAMAPPFWKAEAYDRDFHYSDRIASFLEYADAHLVERGFAGHLMKNNHLDNTAATKLIVFLREQRERTGSRLPHRHHLLVEHISSGPVGGPGNQIILHTFWGGRVNRPYAMALAAAWEDRFNQHLEIHATNDCVVLVLPHEIDSDELLSMVPGAKVEELLRKRLGQSGFLGARFREAAGRSLLLTKRKINERMPLWLIRLQSQRLLSAVAAYDDFPILLEAWRSCLTDAFDLENLRTVLAELAAGIISWTEIESKIPSPLGQSVSWQQINQYMYMDDSQPPGKPASLNEDLIHDIVMSDDFRPSVSQDTIDRYESKRQRLHPGYSPDASGELLDWVKERQMIPQAEWEGLCLAIRRDHELDVDELLAPLSEKLVWITPPEGKASLMAPRESVRRLLRFLYDSDDTTLLSPVLPADHIDGKGAEIVLEDLPMDDLIGALPSRSNPEDRGGEEITDDPAEEIRTDIVWEWFQFYGPRTAEFIQSTLGISKARLNIILDSLADSERLVIGQLVSEAPEGLPSVCDSDNYASLLRMKRAEARPNFESMDITYLAPYLAKIQKITRTGTNREDLVTRIEQLQCYEASAELWEKEIFPARLAPYDPSWLDSVMQETDLLWVGKKDSGNGDRKAQTSGKIMFAFESDLDLLGREDPTIRETEGGKENGESPSPDTTKGTETDLFPQGAGRFDFSTLLQTSGLLPHELSTRLWELVWHGAITNDTFVAMRRGIESRFDSPGKVPRLHQAPLRRRRSRGRSRFSKWKGALPSAGYWYPISYPEASGSILESEELKKERIRILMDRYGIIFRELLLRELPGFRWPDLFRSLRIMELSGEVLTGYFFHGIPGPQFISPRGFHLLQQDLDEKEIYWINAADPASLCGIGLDCLKGTLPKRLSGTHLVYRGPHILLVSARLGKSLTFHVEPTDPNVYGTTGFLRHLLTRAFQPLRQVTIESINGVDAARSPYADIIGKDFDTVVDFKKIVLYRKRG